MSKHRFQPGVTPVEHQARRMIADRNQRDREAMILAKFGPSTVQADFVLAGQKGSAA